MRMRRALAIVVIPTVTATAAGFAAGRVRGWYRTWGVDPGEAVRSLPGDAVVAMPTGGITRGIDIDAPPEAVWPWLLQMGYGRAGWYSYDGLDQRGRSADAIVDAWGSLSVGDIVPTHPGGGFEVAILDPGHALVLRSDTALVTDQAAAAKASGTGLDTATSGVKVSGALLSGTPQQFAASWAFVLEPRDGGGTRLVERFRIWYGDGSPGSRFVGPLVGFGVFVMMQKQMVGLRDRAERLARTRSPASPTSPGPEAATGDVAPSASAVPEDAAAAATLG